jgi:hypothetical protein
MAQSQPLPASLEQTAPARPATRQRANRVQTWWRKYSFFYLLALPGLIYFFIFHYIPMFGIVIAFKEISPYDAVHDIFYGEWIGLENFRRFFNSIYFWNVLTNTLIIVYHSGPAPERGAAVLVQANGSDHFLYASLPIHGRRHGLNHEPALDQRWTCQWPD